MTSTATQAAKYTISCASCGVAVDRFAGRCGECAGILDASYDQPLPHEVDLQLPCGERYWPAIPLMDRESLRVDLPTTPLVEIGERRGVRLYGKLEGTLPTGSTKYRLASISVPFLIEHGVECAALSSTGNTVDSFLRVIEHYEELRMEFYVPASVGWRPPAHVPGNARVHIVPTDYAGTHRALAALAGEGVTLEGGFGSVARREAAKLAYIEAFDQLKALGVSADAVVQAVASGLGIYGANLAFEGLHRAGRLASPARLYCAQQETCAPMVTAFASERAGSPSRPVVEDPHGPAPALLLGDPYAWYDEVARVVRRSGGSFVAVPTRSIEEVMSSYGSSELVIGPSSSVALAGVDELINLGELVEGDVVLVMLTGGPGR